MDTAAFLSEIVTAGLDAESADLLAILDRRHKMMCRRARAFQAEKVITGGTVIGQQRYAPPTGLVEARAVEVDGTPYGKAKRRDIFANSQGVLSITYPGTAFAITHDSAGLPQIALIPTPTDAGKVITVIGSFLPPTLTISPATNLIVDDDALEGLKAGCWASWLGRPDEGRPDLAQTYESQFAAACEELRVRVQDLLRGPGPLQIRMSAPYG